MFIFLEGLYLSVRVYVIHFTAVDPMCLVLLLFTCLGIVINLPTWYVFINFKVYVVVFL